MLVQDTLSGRETEGHLNSSPGKKDNKKPSRLGKNKQNG